MSMLKIFSSDEKKSFMVFFLSCFPPYWHFGFLFERGLTFGMVGIGCVGVWSGVAASVTSPRNGNPWRARGPGLQRKSCDDLWWFREGCHWWCTPRDMRKHSAGLRRCCTNSLLRRRINVSSPCRQSGSSSLGWNYRGNFAQRPNSCTISKLGIL